MPRATDASREDFAAEARSLFASLGLDASGGGTPGGGGRYDDLNKVFQHPTSGAGIYIGNHRAASSRETLGAHGIGHVVNCTDDLPLYFDGLAGRPGGMQYVPGDGRFHVATWWRARSAGKMETDAAVLEFFRPLFEWVDAALERGSSVLVHCLAGAHRAGTTGVALMMYRGKLDAATATRTAQELRPVVNPMGSLGELLVLLDKALASSR